MTYFLRWQWSEPHLERNLWIWHPQPRNGTHQNSRARRGYVRRPQLPWSSNIPSCGVENWSVMWKLGRWSIYFEFRSLKRSQWTFLYSQVTALWRWRMSTVSLWNWRLFWSTLKCETRRWVNILKENFYMYSFCWVVIYLYFTPFFKYLKQTNCEYYFYD